MGQIGHMEEIVSKPLRSLKVSLMSLMILGACGAVTYNVLLSQSPKQKLPGTTAVRVQVKDIDVARVQQDVAPSSIDQLLSRQPQQLRPAPDPALTRSVQQQLAHLGFYDGALDGQYGPQTIAAIKQYQRQNALKQTGAVSQKLLQHLSFTRKIADASNNTGSIQPSGQSNASVRKVQERLTLFGYNPGKIDGVMGASTTRAIELFEADRSLPVTGKITAKLLQELGS